MSDTKEPLRLFVAMPGDLGKKSRYSNVNSVKSNFLDRIRAGVEEKLRRTVTMFIEKEKNTTGDIHASMFREAIEADVYIADLTNANPNVYLELGVRWALRDGLTIPIFQNTEDLRFNVGSTRAFQYTPDNVIMQMDALVETIVNYQLHPRVDSPVRDRMDLVTISRAELHNLKVEIDRLKNSRGEDLFRAAVAEENPDAKLSLLKRAIDVNPAYVDALVELGVLLRELSEYDDSESKLEQARRLAPQQPNIHRQLGVTLSKAYKLSEAVACFTVALKLDDRDPETWSNLGGALRRLGLAALDREQLDKARDAYQQASQLAPYDLYAALNVCRLDLVLARWDQSRLAMAIKEFQRRLPLCEYQVSEAPHDCWRKFDLAEAFLFSSSFDRALKTYRAALDMVPQAKRADTLRSVREPLKGYLDTGILPSDLKDAVTNILSELPTQN